MSWNFTSLASLVSGIPGQLQAAWTVVSADPRILLPYGGLIAGVIGVLFAAGKFLAIPLSKRVKKHLEERIRVRVIKRNDDRSLESIVDLYRRRIEFESQIDTELIRAWHANPKIRKLTNITILAAYFKGEVIGFMQLMWSAQECVLFVSYLVVDESSQAGRTRAAKALINFAVKRFRRKCAKVAHFVFEVEKPRYSGAASREKSQRDSARVRRLKRLCTECGLWSGEVEAQYFQPEMPNETGLSNQHEMLIVLAGREKQAPKFIDASQYLKILRYIYFDIYALVYEGDDELVKMYRDELESLAANARRNLPDSIKLL